MRTILILAQSKACTTLSQSPTEVFISRPCSNPEMAEFSGTVTACGHHHLVCRRVPLRVSGLLCLFRPPIKQETCLLPCHSSIADNCLVLYPPQLPLTGSMAARMHISALVVLFIVLACIPAPTIAADFTSGMTIDSYKYFFNVTSYANMSMDVRDMHVSFSIARFALTAAAAAAAEAAAFMFIAMYNVLPLLTHAQWSSFADLD